jgi:phosphoribosylformylglycinamidine synthase subunit PurSL
VTALAEMCVAGRLGAEIDLAAVPCSEDISTDSTILFSESNARFIVEVRPEDATAFETRLRNCPSSRVGFVRSEGTLKIIGLNHEIVFEVAVERLCEAWQGSIG